MTSQIASLMGPNATLAYLDQDGKIALTVSIGDGSGDVTRFDPLGTVNTGAGPFLHAATNVTYLLYADGNIKQYEDSHADGSDINIQFADAGPITSFGLNSNYTVGPMTTLVKTTAAGFVTTETFAQSLDAPGKEVTHLVQYNLATPTNPNLLAGSFDPTTHEATLSLQDAAHTSPLTNSGFGTLDRLIGDAGGTIITHDGGSLVGNDGSSLIASDGVLLVGNDGSSLISATPGTALVGNDGSSLVGNDGSSVVSHDGGSLVGNDGSSLSIALHAGDALISQDGSTLVGNDGSSLIGDAGGTLISQDGGGLVGNDGSSLVGNDGSSLIAQGTAALISQRATSLLPSNPSLLVGNDGSSVVSHDGGSLYGIGGIFNGRDAAGSGGSLIASDAQTGAGAGVAADTADQALAKLGSGLAYDGNAYLAFNLDAGSPRAYAAGTADDFAGSAATTGALVVGGSATTGELEIIGDRDWFKVDLTAGHVYQIDLKGAATQDGTLGDPWLRLYDSSSAPVAQIDDGGVGNNSKLIYTALTTGTYYAEASGRGDAEIGTYALTIADIPQAISINPVAGDNVIDKTELAAATAHGLVISGTTSGLLAGQALTVALNGHSYATAVGAGGSWQASVAAADVAALAPGVDHVVVSADGLAAHTSEDFSVTATINPLGPAFADWSHDFSLRNYASAVLANGTVVDAVYDHGQGFPTIELLNPDGSTIGFATSQASPGFINDMEIVALTGGGFASVFAIEVVVGGQAAETWYADFYDANGVAGPSNVQLLPARDASGVGYHGTNVVVTATSNGGFLLAQNYEAPNAPGQPGTDSQHFSFPTQSAEVRASFFDSTGALVHTTIVNNVLKTSIDGTDYSGLDGVNTSTQGGIAALADGSVAVPYLDRQYQVALPFGPPQDTWDISVEVLSPHGANTWIDVRSDPLPPFATPTTFIDGTKLETVALSGSTFGVLWEEGHSDHVGGADDLVLKTFDESGQALSGEIVLANDAHAENSNFPGGYNAVALHNGNFLVEYSTVTTTVIDAVSSAGTVLDSLVFSGTNLLYTLKAASDGTFYVTSPTTDPNLASNFQTQHYALGNNIIAPVPDAPPITIGSVTLAAIAENSGARVITQAQLLGNASDVDGPSLTAINLAIAIGAGTLADNHNGTWSYTPAAHDHSSVAFSYQVTDGIAAPVADSATLAITATGAPIDMPPVVTGAVTLAAIAENSGAHVITQAQLLGNATDADGPSLTAIHLAISTGIGTLVDNHDATWSYTPAAGDSSAVSFSYQVTDGLAAPVADSATLDITPKLSAHNPAVGSANNFSGNGDSGILLQNADGTPVIWTVNGTSLISGPTIGGNPGSDWHEIGTGDFNGDGKSDILWQNKDGTVAEWFLNGTSLISGANVGFNPGSAWHAIGAGDFNGDGKSDILFQNTDGTPAVWLMDGLNILSGANVGFNPGPAWHVIGAGDFNGDGKADILWQNADGTPAVWLMNGTNLLSGSNVGFNPGADWHVAGTGDFNGDGKADILWQNKDGTPAIWLMDGFNLLSGSNVGTNPGPAWHVVNTGDFNGDGKSDILWQNDNGMTAVWLMDGTSLIHGGTVGDAGSNHVVPQHHDLFV